MQFGDGVHAALPVSSILLGFLFAGFWWTLNRELTFKPEERHFKLGIGLQPDDHRIGDRETQRSRVLRRFLRQPFFLVLRSGASLLYLLRSAAHHRGSGLCYRAHRAGRDRT